MRSSVVAAAAPFSLAILALASIACAPQRREVQVNWTFAGGQTCAAVGVATIEIDIGGEILQPNQFACTDPAGGTSTGVDLGRFLVGSYDVEITGFDTNSNVTYLLDTTIRVSDSVNPNVFNLDVPAFTGQGGGDGSLTLLWTFDGMSCAQAGVSTVLVNIDNAPVTDENNNPNLPCTEEGTDGVSIAPIPVGTHSVTISANGSGGIAYADSLSANVADRRDTELSPNLTSGGTDGGSPSDGGTDGGTAGTATAELSWSFAGMSCADAQVDTVTVDVDGADAGTVPCTSSGSDGATITGISSGTHTLTISGVRGSGASAELVYATSGAGTSGNFVAGLTTHLIVSAAATSPGVGGVTLALSFPSGGPDCTNTTGSGTTVSYTLTTPAGVAKPAANFTCGGTSGSSAITVCDPGTAGCGGGNAGLTAGVWTISASASGFTASTTPFSVPNDAVGSGTVTFTSN